MKVLQVMASCAQVSGVAQAMMNYYRHIAKEVTFDFLVFWENDYTFRTEIEELGGRVFLTPEPGLRGFSQYRKAVEEFFRTHAGEYDAVQLHDLYLNPVIFTLAKKYGVKVRIAHSHSEKYSDHLKGSVRNWLLYRSLPYLATDFWAASVAAGNAAFGKRITSTASFTVINNAISLERFLFNPGQRAEVRSEFNISPDAFVLGHIGRFVPQKNHELLVHVFAEVKRRRPDACLLLVGEGGPLRPAVETRVKKLGIGDSVHFAGLRTDIGALLSAMDSFCLPSLYEGFGIVLAEAQTNGLPCLASSQVPEEARILPSYRQQGLGDPPARWAETILSLPTNRLEGADKLVAERGFDIRKTSRLLVSHYQKLIHDEGKP